MWFLVLPGLLLAAAGAAVAKATPKPTQVRGGRTYRYVVEVEALDGKPIAPAQLLEHLQWMLATDVLVMPGPPLKAMYSAKAYADHWLPGSIVVPLMAGAWKGAPRMVRFSFLQVQEIARAAA